ncbi:hypothetical protein E0703_08475 [Lactobacillus helveticus]|nr:hypothetical protein [Lactobacillus helveticus]
MFSEINLRNHSSLHKLFYGLAHIVAYKLKNVPNRYIMQKLPWLPWGQFTRWVSKIKISPYIKL